MKRALRCALLATAGFVATTAAAQTKPDATATLEEIVVTAQKRAQNLQDVPISVTPLTGEKLVVNRIENVADIGALVPNLTVHTSAGGVALPTFALRGVNSFGVLVGSDKEVSIYLDGVYIGAASGSIFDIPNLERIEVLKGPQGTLFGRNATAGAINIITRNPTGEFGVHQQLTGGTYGEFRSTTRVNLPSQGPLSAELYFQHVQRRGDIRNLGEGAVWDFTTQGQGILTAPKWLGDQHTNSAGSTLRLQKDRLDIVYKFDWNEEHGSPEGTGMLHLNPAAAGPAAAYMAAVINNQPNPSILSPFALTRPDAVNNSFSTLTNNKAFGHNVTAQIQLADHLSLKNIIAYRSAYALGNYELSGYGGLIFPQAAVAPLAQLTAGQLGLPPQFAPFIEPFLQPFVGQPWVLFATTTIDKSKQWSDEIQMNFDSKYLTLTSGFLHFSQDSSHEGTGGAPNSIVLMPVPGGIIPNQYIAPSIVNQTSNAVYSQAEVHVLPKVDVVGGYRLTWDNKHSTFTAPGVFAEDDYHNARPSYLGGINYKPFTDTLIYGKYSTAYMSGGASFGLQYLPETVSSWEFGVKTDLLDHRLRTNLALFRAKYINLQSPTAGSLLRPPIPNAPVLLTNAGDLKAQGFEFEGTALPMKGLTFGAGIGFTDAYYTKVNPILGDLGNYRLTGRPKWTTNLSAQYDTPPVWGPANLSFYLDANYRSSFFLVAIPDPNPAVDALYKSPGAWVLNARVSLMHLPVKRGSAEFAFWVRNLTNDGSIDFSDVLGISSSASYERARTIGVDLIYDF
jgi:iron complex outermembrane receptor protein